MSESSTVDLPRLRNEHGLASDYPSSFVALGGGALWLERVRNETRLAVLWPRHEPQPALPEGESGGEVLDRSLWLCPLNPSNATALRDLVHHLRPTPLGLHTSAGFGDRLGLATPGHIRALHAVTRNKETRHIAPLFAQQSIREMQRTARSARNVLDDATWGAFEAGWSEPLGADADHLKTYEDIDQTAACGYSFYTIDPGEFVNDGADAAPAETLQRDLEGLPWKELETDFADLRRRYTGRPVELDDRTISIGLEALTRAAVKYAGAIAHVQRMYQHLSTKQIPFELEMSVDETETPTSLAEHVYIASELRRLRVAWVSLAPRFIGSFEKGVDFIGDLDLLRADLEGHAAIARTLGPYKLSLHSGSDKFTVYPLIEEATRGMVHLKTAGTSYLEALRVAAQIDAGLFREILSFAREHFERDRATYHVSAVLDRVPTAATLDDEELPRLLDDFDARQVLHVTFGSTLAAFRPRLMQLLKTHENAYAAGLERHFVRHLAPFAKPMHGAPAAST